MSDDTTQGPNPSGLCMCGCGGKTPLAKANGKGLVMGLPARFIQGHNANHARDEYTVTESGCWMWRNTPTTRYGRVKWDGVPSLAHRVYWERAHDEKLPTRIHLHHKCGNKPCVNPDHLVAVRRENHGRLHARLTLDDYDSLLSESRTMKPYGRTVVLAKKYGISTSHANKIINGFWKPKRGVLS